jgi:hypothetical protein
MNGTLRTGLALLAALALAAVALSFLPLGRALRYVTYYPSDGPSVPAVILSTIPLALVHERVMRGLVYGVLRRRLEPGLGAPVVAIVGALLPAAVRLWLLPRPPAPLVVLALLAYLVEMLLGLGLAWLALGTGSTVPGALAVAAIWSVRLLVTVRFHGGVVPLLEIVAAGLSALTVALVLVRPLAPHRDAVMGVA